MMFWPDHDLSGWGWAAMTISMVLFWALLIAAGVLLVRTLDRSSGAAADRGRSSPDEVLAERFARGQIDEEEYRRRLSVLTDHRSTPTR
jgi:putative membrane protein